MNHPKPGEFWQTAGSPAEILYFDKQSENVLVRFNGGNPTLYPRDRWRRWTEPPLPMTKNFPEFIVIKAVPTIGRYNIFIYKADQFSVKSPRFPPVAGTRFWLTHTDGRDKLEFATREALLEHLDQVMEDDDD